MSGVAAEEGLPPDAIQILINCVTGKGKARKLGKECSCKFANYSCPGISVSTWGQQVVESFLSEEEQKAGRM